MKTDKEFLTTHEVITILRSKGIPIQDFIDAVKSGKIPPYWEDDGSPIDWEDLQVVLNEIEEAKNAH